MSSATSALVRDLDLRAPAEGDAELAHDVTFGRWDDTFSLMRDAVNVAVRALNSVGAGLPELPSGSLEELIVEPLTGDYRAMRANADACRTVDRAFGVVATDTAAVAADTALSWQGLAGAACAGRMGASAAGARAVGLAIGQAAGLFEVVATTSERLGIRVEELVVRVGAALARLFRKVLSRAAGPLGWASLATEVAVRGFDVVADVIADVEVVVDGLETLLALREEASAWAHAQSERVGVLLGLSERLGLP